ncbi:MAG: glycosyltransferase family 2 protein [Planctomycetes bacterium]|nr:glycosyltransferase family 2 protein [Planctomycetota bacterium]
MIQASIIIPTYNRGKLLCDTIRHLVELLPADAEIIVVDQSDEVYPGLMEIMRNHNFRLRYYKIFIKGLPHARNFGLERAIGEIVIFCDDDIIPGRGFIKNHLRNYRDKEIGGVGGRILPAGKDGLINQPSTYRHFPAREKGDEKSRRNAVIGRIRWWDAHLTDNFDATTRGYIDHAQGCNMSFRKEALMKAGTFDERFGGSAHLEETDMCLRVRKAGDRLVFDPEAALVHLKDNKGGCRAENYQQWFYWYGHNGMLFFLKNFKHHLLPVFVVSRFLRLILSACKRRNPLMVFWGIRGYWKGLKTYKPDNP